MYLVNFDSTKSFVINLCDIWCVLFHITCLFPLVLVGGYLKCCNVYSLNNIQTHNIIKDQSLYTNKKFYFTVLSLGQAQQELHILYLAPLSTLWSYFANYQLTTKNFWAREVGDNIFFILFSTEFTMTRLYL